MNDVDLTGVLLKLDRAVVHIEALRSEVDAFKSWVPPPFDVEFRFETSADGVRH